MSVDGNLLRSPFRFRRPGVWDWLLANVRFVVEVHPMAVIPDEVAEPLLLGLKFVGRAMVVRVVH